MSNKVAPGFRMSVHKKRLPFDTAHMSYLSLIGVLSALHQRQHNWWLLSVFVDCNGSLVYVKHATNH